MTKKKLEAFRKNVLDLTHQFVRAVSGIEFDTAVQALSFCACVILAERAFSKKRTPAQKRRHFQRLSGWFKNGVAMQLREIEAQAFGDKKISKK